MGVIVAKAKGEQVKVGLLVVDGAFVGVGEHADLRRLSYQSIKSTFPVSNTQMRTSHSSCIASAAASLIA